MAIALKQLLLYLHEQKRQRGVDAMLLRLWEPILWRALKVPKRSALLTISKLPRSASRTSPFPLIPTGGQPARPP